MKRSKSTGAFSNTLLKLLTLIFITGTSTFADVEINEKNFPDMNFRKWIEEQEWGKAGVIRDTEIASISKIIVFDLEIRDLTGIEHFTALKILNCNYNELTFLDVSANHALTNLYCSNNQLIVLDVSTNLMLKDLICDYNKLTKLDLSNNLVMEYLDCSYNYISKANLPTKPAAEVRYWETLPQY